MIARITPINDAGRALGRCSHCQGEREYPTESFRRVKSCGCLRSTNHAGGTGKPARRVATTRDRNHCVNGHAFTEANTYQQPNGRRACRVCRAKSDSERADREAAARPLRVRVVGRRGDLAVIGCAHIRWDGTPILLADLARLLGEDDLELRVGLLRPWVQALVTPRGPVLFARTCSYSEVRDFIDAGAMPLALQEAA